MPPVLTDTVTTSAADAGASADAMRRHRAASTAKVRMTFVSLRSTLTPLQGTCLTHITSCIVSSSLGPACLPVDDCAARSPTVIQLTAMIAAWTHARHPSKAYNTRFVNQRRICHTAILAKSAIVSNIAAKRQRG